VNLQYPPGVKVAPGGQTHPGLGSEVAQLPPSQVQVQTHLSEHAPRPTSATGAAARAGSFPGMGDLVASFESAKQKGIYFTSIFFVSFHPSSISWCTYE